MGIFERTFSQALHAYENENYDSAEQLVNSIIGDAGAGYKIKAESYVLLGKIYNLSEVFDDGIEACNNAIRLDWKCVSAYAVRGDSYLGKREFNKAIEDCTKAIDLCEQSGMGSTEDIVLAYTNRGRTYNGIGKYDLAIKDFNIALSKNPNDEMAIQYHIRAALFGKNAKKIHDDMLNKELKKRADEVERSRQKRFEKREKVYRQEKKQAEKFRKNFFISLLASATLLYGGIIAVIIGSLFGYLDDIKVNYSNSLVLLSLVLTSSLLLSPLVWIIRIVNRRIEKLWALEEDAHANFILAHELDLQRTNPNVNHDLVRQFFDHHDKRGSAQLIADWKDSDEKGISIVERVREKLTPPK